MHYIGEIDREIYRCVTGDIRTTETIITDERIKHIQERHQGDFERVKSNLKAIIETPDYIIESNKPNTALILKEVKVEGGILTKTILRIQTSYDNPEFKNSILTLMCIDDKEWARLLKNKNVIYKRR